MENRSIYEGKILIVNYANRNVNAKGNDIIFFKKPIKEKRNNSYINVAFFTFFVDNKVEVENGDVVLIKKLNSVNFKRSYYNGHYCYSVIINCDIKKIQDEEIEKMKQNNNDIDFDFEV